MRVDATIAFEIKDSKDGEGIKTHIPNAVSGSVQGVIVNAFRNGWWSGPGNTGTYYPTSRLYSARVTYRSHCGDDECTDPHVGEERDTYAHIVTPHTHTLPTEQASEPASEEKAAPPPAKRGRGRK